MDSVTEIAMGIVLNMMLLIAAVLTLMFALRWRRKRKRAQKQARSTVQTPSFRTAEPPQPPGEEQELPDWLDKT